MRPSLLWIIAVLAACVVVVSIAKAHGPAEWIQEGHYKNAVGELCCGPRDCGLYVGGTIEHKPGGYQVNAAFQIGEGDSAKIININAFIREQDATPSPTGDYWLCSWGGQIRCFFAPTPGS